MNFQSFKYFSITCILSSIVEGDVGQFYDFLKKLRPHWKSDFDARTCANDKYCFCPEHCTDHLRC